MKKLFWFLPLMVLLLSGCGQSANTNASKTGAPSAQSSVQKFSDQPYYSRSYLISAETLSPEAQAAIAGFQLTKQPQADGSVQIFLKATESQYHDQQYSLKPGEQLYFIDRTLSDDPSGKEINIGDDTAVIVDSQGNVVQPPTGF